MSTGESVRRLLRNILFFANDPELVKRVFRFAFDFVTGVAVRRLTELAYMEGNMRGPSTADCEKSFQRIGIRQHAS